MRTAGMLVTNCVHAHQLGGAAELNAAISSAFGEGKAVLICDPTEKSSSFLQYNANVMDCKGIFVLDKIHGKLPLLSLKPTYNFLKYIY